MTVTLDEWRVRYILEALRVCVAQWSRAAKATDDEDVQADYGNEIARLSIVYDSFERAAVEAFGPEVKEFSPILDGGDSPRSGILHPGLQKRLDLLDELIDTLEREKGEAKDDDLPHDVEEAKEVQQMARDDYSRGDLQKAFLEVCRAEYCLFFGRQELTNHKALMDEIGKALG